MFKNAYFLTRAVKELQYEWRSIVSLPVVEDVVSWFLTTSSAYVKMEIASGISLNINFISQLIYSAQVYFHLFYSYLSSYSC